VVKRDVYRNVAVYIQHYL